jgi:hypothetical protein
MYFGLYRIPNRHHRFDALAYEAPCPGPDLFDRLVAWLRRVLG